MSFEQLLSDLQGLQDESAEELAKAQAAATPDADDEKITAAAAEDTGADTDADDTPDEEVEDDEDDGVDGRA